MRLIDADALMERIWRDRLDSRELISSMVENAQTIEERKTGRWIPVTERLPEQGRQYLVMRTCANGTRVVEILWHDADDLWWCRTYKPNGKVTHWMPLPEPPKEVEHV